MSFFIVMERWQTFYVMSTPLSQSYKLAPIEPDQLVFQRSVGSTGGGLKGLHEDSTGPIIVGDDVPNRAMPFDTSFGVLCGWNYSDTFHLHSSR